MSARTFVVTVSESPTRVVVEDVRSGRRQALADGLPGLAPEITRLLGAYETPTAELDNDARVRPS